MSGTLKRTDEEGGAGGDLSPTTIGGGDSEDVESYLTAVWNDQTLDEYITDVSDLAQLIEREIRILDSAGQGAVSRRQLFRAAQPPSAKSLTTMTQVSYAWPHHQEVGGYSGVLARSKQSASPLLGLCMDQSGNHLVQKLLEAPSSSRDLFEQVLKGHCVELAYNTYGCRVLQKALDCFPVDLRIYVCHQELGPHISTLIQDQNGNHVIQKCVDRLPPSECYPIIKACLKDPLRTSLHAYGCRVMQRILEHCQHNRWTHSLLDELQIVLPALIKDQFGNYVVQHILRYGRYCDVKCIVDIVVCNLLSYSCHKFSSNVAERCLESYIARDLKLALVSAAFDVPTNGLEKPPILSMIRDPYANYVVQKILSSDLIDLDNQQRRDVLNKLEKHLPALRKFTYGRHIVEGIEKLKRRADAQ